MRPTRFISKSRKDQAPPNQFERKSNTSQRPIANPIRKSAANSKTNTPATSLHNTPASSRRNSHWLSKRARNFKLNETHPKDKQHNGRWLPRKRQERLEDDAINIQSDDSIEDYWNSIPRPRPREDSIEIDDSSPDEMEWRCVKPKEIIIDESPESSPLPRRRPRPTEDDIIIEEFSSPDFKVQRPNRKVSDSISIDSFSTTSTLKNDSENEMQVNGCNLNDSRKNAINELMGYLSDDESFGANKTSFNGGVYALAGLYKKANTSYVTSKPAEEYLSSYDIQEDEIVEETPPLTPELEDGDDDASDFFNQTKDITSSTINAENEEKMGGFDEEGSMNESNRTMQENSMNDSDDDKDSFNSDDTCSGEEAEDVFAFDEGVVTTDSEDEHDNDFDLEMAQFESKSNTPKTITANVVSFEGKDGIDYSMLDNGVILVTPMRHHVPKKTITYEEGSGYDLLVPPSIGFGPPQLFIANPTIVPFKKKV